MRMTKTVSRSLTLINDNNFKSNKFVDEFTILWILLNLIEN